MKGVIEDPVTSLSLGNLKKTLSHSAIFWIRGGAVDRALPSREPGPGIEDR
jgi:hypothetical protein